MSLRQIAAKQGFRELVYSQLILYLTFAVCIIIAPASLAANDGLSYFGVHKATIIPYGAGLLATAYLILKAADYLAQIKRLAPAKRALKLFAILVAGVVVTPYSLGNWFDWIHTAIGTALFSLQLILAFWLIFKIENDWLNWLLVAIQIGGGLISLVYLAPSNGILLQGQLLFQAAFSILLVRSLAVVVE